MNLTSISQVRELLDSLAMRPSRALGQNFLIDLNILNILVETADISSKDMILEIGPGLGVVTERLVELAARVTAVEKDRKLFEFLEDKFKNNANLELICADMLDIDTDSVLQPGSLKVVSNLPYSSGSRILVNIAMSEYRPRQITVTVQEEVAERLVAVPNNKNYGPLTVWMQNDYEIKLVKTISPTCFWPRPDIKSVIVNMKRRVVHAFPSGERRFFYDLTKSCFLHRRKQLATILAALPDRFSPPEINSFELLKELGLEPKDRPENLSIDDWRRLASTWHRLLAR